MKVGLYMRARKQLVRMFDMDAPESATFLQIPVQTTKFTSFGAVQNVKMLKFQKMSMDTVSVFFCGNMFVCDVGDDELTEIAK